jgi:AraC-like DNA-binding protein
MATVRRALYRRQLALFLALSLVVVAVLSVPVFTSFRRFSEQQIEQGLNASLDRVEYQMRFVFERAIYVALALYRSPSSQAFLFGRDVDELERVALQDDVRERLAAHPFLYSGAIYNREIGFVATSPRKEAPDSPHKLAELLREGGSSQRTYLVRRLEPTAAGFSSEDVLTLVYSDDVTSTGYEHAVIIDIPLRSMLEHVASAADAADYDAFLMTREPRLVYPHGHVDHATGVVDSPRFDETRGMIELGSGAESALAAFAHDVSTGTTAVVLYELEELRRAAYGLQRRIAGIALVVLAAGWALSIVLTRYAYLPVQRLLDRVDPEHFYTAVRTRLNEMEYLSTHFSEVTERAAELEDASMRQSTVLTELRLRALLLDEPVPESIRNPNPDGTMYACILIRVRPGIEYRYEHEHVRHAASEIAPVGSTVVFVARGESVVLIPAESSAATVARRILDELNCGDERTGSGAENAFNGAALDEPTVEARLRKAYRTLNALSRYQFFYERPMLFTPELVRRTHAGRASYPTDREKELLEKLRFGHRASYVSELQNICDGMRDCSYESVVSVLLQLALAIARGVDEISARNDRLELPYSTDIARRAEAWSSFDEAITWFVELYDSFQDASDRAEAAIGGQNRERVERAAGFIRDHISDPQLSVPTIADAVNLSRSYFSRVFRAQVGVSVNEFIARERIERAERLLADTDDTVESVARACGIQNTKYFFQLFRKHVGVTPAAFRASQRERSTV